VTLYYVDECGVSPSQPVSWSWTLRGRRKRLPYATPQGKRVNALAARRVSGSAEVDWELFRRTLQADDLLAFLRTLPREPGTPRVVVLDNASIHKNRTNKAALPDLWQERSCSGSSSIRGCRSARTRPMTPWRTPWTPPSSPTASRCAPATALNSIQG